jgi:hypothetical protein
MEFCHAPTTSGLGEKLLAGACVDVAICLLVAVALYGYVRFRCSQIATVKGPRLRVALPVSSQRAGAPV